MELELNGLDGRTLNLSTEQRSGCLSVCMTYKVVGFEHHADEVVAAPWVHLPLDEARRMTSVLLNVIGADQPDYPNVA